jgi:hypothetical protein
MQTKMTDLTYSSPAPSGLLSSAPDDSYAFRNRFDITSNSGFNISDAEHVLNQSSAEEHVVLTATVGQKTIKECASLALVGSPYADFDTALSAGRKWPQIATSVFARLTTGVNFGDDDADKLQPRDVAELHYRGMFNSTATDRVYYDRVGLFVFRLHPEPTFVNIGMNTIGLSGLGDLPDLVAEAEQRHSGVWQENLRLAYDLVHAGLADTKNPEPRYILTVTAIEALIPYREKHPELSRLLDALQPIVDGMSGFDDDTRTAVKQLLHSDKMESVRKYGRALSGRLSGTYDRLSPKDYFDKAYGTRSDLAHGNLRDKPNLTKGALTQQYAELHRFVVDILESWTENPSFGTPDTTA